MRERGTPEEISTRRAEVRELELKMAREFHRNALGQIALWCEIQALKGTMSHTGAGRWSW